MKRLLAVGAACAPPLVSATMEKGRLVSYSIEPLPGVIWHDDLGDVSNRRDDR